MLLIPIFFRYSIATHKIKVKITDDVLIISGKVNSEIQILDIKNTILSKEKKLRINFADGTFIHLIHSDGDLSRPKILNDMI